MARSQHDEDTPLVSVTTAIGMDQVLPGLFVGSYRDSKNLAQLSTNNISHIVAVHVTAKKWYKDKNYLLISAADTPQQNLLSYIPRCNDFIHSARQGGGAVLIHCLAGMSRSVTVALAYIISVTSLDYRTALQAVRAARPIANPNDGFLKQLTAFEADKLEQERRRLRDKYRGYDPEADETRLRQLTLLFRVSLLSGETCEGHCRLGHRCPRGICNHSKRTVGIFRQRWSSHSSLPGSPEASRAHGSLEPRQRSSSTRSLAAGLTPSPLVTPATTPRSSPAVGRRVK
ncbi:dual specificity protein phosphatase 22-B-like [Pollicipes pollicipes]|uniref:dual specificity protein phosphatase 22-B-like n=1 Tax=Pollicipes pollicipes TaxID=41117 RepID=UPI0018850ACE|nr:dual specificity protein phosphatase 22-B-like [Pollicipes pollicipes]